MIGMLPSKWETVSGRGRPVVLAGLLDGVWSKLMAVVSSIKMSLGVPGLAGSGRRVDVLGVLCGDGEFSPCRVQYVVVLEHNALNCSHLVDVGMPALLDRYIPERLHRGPNVWPTEDTRNFLAVALFGI